MFHNIIYKYLTQAYSWNGSYKRISDSRDTTAAS